MCVPCLEIFPFVSVCAVKKSPEVEQQEAELRKTIAKLIHSEEASEVRRERETDTQRERQTERGTRREEHREKRPETDTGTDADREVLLRGQAETENRVGVAQIQVLRESRSFSERHKSREEHAQTDTLRYTR